MSSPTVLAHLRREVVEDRHLSILYRLAQVHPRWLHTAQRATADAVDAHHTKYLERRRLIERPAPGPNGYRARQVRITQLGLDLVAELTAA